MKTKKKKHFRPWLTPTGVEIPTAELRIISASWDRVMWNAYLDWYANSRREALIHPTIYDWICEEHSESLFEQLAQDSSQENRELCERELSSLPPLEAAVLRKYFLDGRTEVEIAFDLNRSQTGISKIKNRALSRLKRGNSGDEVLSCRFMRGESCLSDPEPLLWDGPLLSPLKENRQYDPDNHKAEFEQIKTFSIRAALLGLTDTAQKILYLHHWCDFSISQIARRLDRGVNVTAQIESASISKVERAALEFELGTTLGGE